MEKACQLLKIPSIKVRDVSEMCGYSDPFYFSKVFKENFGMSPIQIFNRNTYRKVIQTIHIPSHNVKNRRLLLEACGFLIFI